MENFTWIPFYKELAQKLLDFRNKQNELIEFLIALKDKGLPATTVAGKDKDRKVIYSGKWRECFRMAKEYSIKVETGIK